MLNKFKSLFDFDTPWNDTAGLFAFGSVGFIIFILVGMFVTSKIEWEKSGTLAYGDTTDGAKYHAWKNGKLLIIDPDGTREVIFFEIPNGSVYEYGIYRGEASIVYSKKGIDKNLGWQNVVFSQREAMEMAGSKYGNLINELLKKLE